MQSRRGKFAAPKATTIALLVMVAAIVGVLVATILLVVPPTRPVPTVEDGPNRSSGMWHGHVV